jgi:hypothetical protein
MSQSQLVSVTNLLRSEWLKHCDLCGGNDLAVLDRLYHLREYEQQSHPQEETAVLPLVTAFCRKCGQTWLFNALVLQVIDLQTGGLVDVQT